jgi:T3SS negative regulator,GrlR
MELIMMTEGIFSLSFEADLKQLGSGFAAFKDGKIRGGDAEFLYNGTYSLDGAVSDSAPHFKAEVSVQYYKGINLAIFGKMTQFPIEISGVFTDEGISGHGKIMKFGNDEIDLNGVKIDDFQSEIAIKERYSFLDRQSISICSQSDQYLLSALAAYHENNYIDATNLAYTAIESIVRQLPIEIDRSGKSQHSFLNLIDALLKKNAIAKTLYDPIHALAISEKVLNKKLKSPEDCAFPLCIMAFNSLAKLLEIQSDLEQGKPSVTNVMK